MTKNGTQGTVCMETLAQIKAMYCNDQMGGAKCGYIKAPPSINNSTNLGQSNGGSIKSLDDFENAVSNCDCNNQ